MLWPLKLVIEFPPGATILIPSAAIEHSNMPISPGETRLSITQFTAGALHRWVDNGFQSVAKHMVGKNAEDERRRIEARKRDALSVFSTCDTLSLDQQAL